MDATLEAVKRNTFGDNEAGRTRRAGQIPAVLYGSDSKESISLSVDPKALSKILHSKSGQNTLISLKLDGAGDTRVLVKQYQLEPVSHRLIHADFYKVAMDKALTLTVPIHLTGEAKGVKAQGGVVEFVNREIEIEVLPADIPEFIEVDVTELMLHQGVRVRDIAGDKKWKAVTDGDLLLVHVIMPKVEEVVAPVAGAAPAAAAEPEVAKKGKKDETAEGAAAAPAKGAEKAEKKK
jgi:large subunit ribosomal protein L25